MKKLAKKDMKKVKGGGTVSFINSTGLGIL